MYAHQLSLLIWLPIVAAIVVLLLGERRVAAGRWLSLLASIATLALSVPLLAKFNTQTAAYQFVEKSAWIPLFNAFYALGVDGISLPLVLLTALMTFPVIIAAWTVVKTRAPQ